MTIENVLNTLGWIFVVVMGSWIFWAIVEELSE